MRSTDLRQEFFNFFKTKKHEIVQSAPMVVKNDPTLMFTNAGMNQFKDIFLGNVDANFPRIANTQKCLRVSGKHNDLEEVGHDTYHHTMFEMLGNWSFGDYFKEDAINWAWEFLVDTLGIDKERLYATVFEGDKSDGTSLDEEAKNLWAKHLPDTHILNGNKKDNFWEMGETGPCGPCSEIHVDLRSDEERAKTDGASLVNMDHPLVIEIWNLVFIQYNRKSNGSLEFLPSKHVDTGMGFERLCMVLQNKQSNYDTDLFQPIIQQIALLSGISYGENEKTDIAMRVIADHLRAVAFAITDGQLPSNNKAGYVIRRILRRAVRYGYTFLGQDEPFIYKLVEVLIEVLGKHFTELEKQRVLVEKVIQEEEIAFLKTLATGIKLLEQKVAAALKQNQQEISGTDAFTLYDTYGFPLDLTQLILQEKNMTVSQQEFEEQMKVQKERSKNAASMDTDDWVTVNKGPEGNFIGYDHMDANVKIIRYRKIVTKKKELFQLVFDQTPFYAESGGQIGDNGSITNNNNNEQIKILDTQKENNLIVHTVAQLPKNIEGTFTAKVSGGRRIDIMNNHSATHLMHHALRQVLGDHVEQKGSLVTPDHLRFDFSHFQKLSDDEIRRVEKLVNENIRMNHSLEEDRHLPIAEAKNKGAMMLFGEKYGDTVRVIKFGDSIELCGGTHVPATGTIGFFKIISEGAIAAGIRRIEAVTGRNAEAYIFDQEDTIKQIKETLKNPQHVVTTIKSMVNEHNNLQKQVDILLKEKAKNLKAELFQQAEDINGVKLIVKEIEADSANMLKDIAFQLKGQVNDMVLALGAKINNKPAIAVMVTDQLLENKQLNANSLIKMVSGHIKGGGGGQPFFASAGGKNPDGITAALEEIKTFVSKTLQ